MTGTMLQRVLPHPGLSAMLLVVWLLMANSVTWGGVLLGAIFALVLPVFTQPFWPDRPKIMISRHLFYYAAIVLWDIVIANFQVAGLILFKRNRDLRSCWLVIPVTLNGSEALSMLTATISLTPGTVSTDVSADGQFVLVHALHVTDAEAEVARIEARYVVRLQRIFP